ncbi:hypothetical protein ACHAPT_003482 [Fusarium lateritium]
MASTPNTASQLSYREAILLRATNTTYTETDLARVIHGLPPAQPSTTTTTTTPCRAPENTSLGIFNKLPAEILLLVLDSADLQSLSRISRVSLRCRSLVENLQPYKKVLAHVPTVVTALARTRLLGVHSLGVIHQALFSSKCASCFDFGGFLFLPTCERVCLTCLDENMALRVIPVAIACSIFGLTEQQLTKIPILYSIPGTYGIYDTSRDSTHQQTQRLVCAKQVKKLALEVHGSVENLAQFLSPNDEKHKRLHDAPLEPPGRDPSLLAPPEDDDYAGVASIRFPCVDDEGNEDLGRLCKACEITLESFDYCRKHRESNSSWDYITKDIPEESGYYRPLLARRWRLRTKEAMREHHCWGMMLVMLQHQSYRRLQRLAEGGRG